MSFETDQVLRRELSPGERLLWSGTPLQGIRLRAADALMVPFSLLWGGFAFFWEWQVLHSKAPLFFALWGLPFVAIGIYIIAGRFFLDSYQRARTFYGLTDQRVLIVGGLMNREVQSLSLKNLAEVSLQERADRSGSVLFGPSNPMASMFAGTAWPGMSRRMAPAFDLLADARRVYDLVKDAQRRAA